MKKMLAILLSVTMLVSLAACGPKADPVEPIDPPATEAGTGDADPTEDTAAGTPSEEPDDGLTDITRPDDTEESAAPDDADNTATATPKPVPTETPKTEDTPSALPADPTAPPSSTASLSDLIAKIYATAGVEGPMCFDTALNADNTVYMIGTADVPYLEGIASEAAIMSIPHSLMLLRMAPNADMADAKAKIRANIDPRKWICVGVETDQVIVDSVGDVIFVVMSFDAAAYHDAFLNLGL